MTVKEDECSILDMPPSIVSAERFADIMLSEREAFKLDSMFVHSGSPHYLAALMRALDQAAFRWKHLNAENLIDTQDLEHAFDAIEKQHAPEPHDGYSEAYRSISLYLAAIV